VGSGFTLEEREAAKKVLDSGHPVVVECTFNGVSKSGKLRHPRFKNFRFDVDPKDPKAVGVGQFLDVTVNT
jgi:ATP-dependent DNA ligase